jgi:hypothetical protein
MLLAVHVQSTKHRLACPPRPAGSPHGPAAGTSRQARPGACYWSSPPRSSGPLGRRHRVHPALARRSPLGPIDVFPQGRLASSPPVATDNALSEQPAPLAPIDTPMPVRRPVGEHGWRRPGRPWVGPSRPPTASARADRPRRPAPQPPNGPGWSSASGQVAVDCTAMTVWRTCSAWDSTAPTGSSRTTDPRRQRPGVAGAQRLRGAAVVPGHRPPAAPRRWSWVPTATGTRRWSRAFPGRPGPLSCATSVWGQPGCSSACEATSRRPLVGLLANEYGLEPVHFVMERKLLLESCCSTASTAPNRHPPDRW